MSLWQNYLDAHEARFTAELLEFLRIPSISALPEHAPDVQRAAEWVAARVAAAGLEHVAILPTGGHPVVYADWLHAPGKPTVLIYGHFDVQPVDPVELWSHPPFEPHIEADRVYARGASDDKGNMLVPILALESLLKSVGRLPVNVKLFFEGQEEIGSPQIGAFLPQHRDRFACDLVLSADGGQFSETEPIILVGLRGLCGLQIDVKAAAIDLHSGMYGGMVMNPIHALVMLLASMRANDGVITVAGFYDQVRPLSAADRAKLAAVPFEPDALKQELQVPALFGEAGFSPLEASWARPTLEVNGIWGGFQDAGTKTVLPSEAHAKLTCRLVADQDPNAVVELLRAHIERHSPPGVTVSVTMLDAHAYPYLAPDDFIGNQVAREVLRELYGREPYEVRSGGSIPVCTLFAQHLGAYTASFGFGLTDERIHSPDEFFRLASFRKGQTAYCRLLERLGV
ncbi:dipeptidase [Candidatus Viridilinea mediisalina]|uniref:Peptidase M20 n=1 Tax=Candidatus Viridilinea mediisalina TaxID=2024553 RepID=A0A2A6RF94_9CHLR|nr:dipeptidase [Candidatus Viridilinea mediisalina]PDW01545.1 peptidase M20 [Candidatus Viridilinea mediisalina]